MTERVIEVEVESVGLRPGKSMHGVPVTELEFNPEGLFGDREYMWVEAEPHINDKGKASTIGQFISQREDPILARFVFKENEDGSQSIGYWNPEDLSVDTIDLPEIDDKNAEKMLVSVWGWLGRANDMGDEIAEWGSNIIGRPVRLVKRSDMYPRYVEGDESLGRLGFGDGYPLLVISRASINQLNIWRAEAGKEPVGIDAFRPDIVLGEGIGVFEEDMVGSLTLSGLGLMTERIKACERCIIPGATNQETGERNIRQAVTTTLGKNGRIGTHDDKARYGDGTEVFFGQNHIIRMPEGMKEGETYRLREGDVLQAVITEHPNWVPLERK